MIRTTLFAALFATAGAAFAAPVSYNIDPTHTYASYEVNHLGLSVQAGTFTKISGKLTVDEAAKTGAVDVTIDAASLQTFLGDRSTAVEFKNGKPAAVKGNLTLLGVTKPVTLKLVNVTKAKHPMTGAENWGANAVATIKRSEFGMKTFLPAISDEVKLNIALEAAKAE